MTSFSKRGVAVLAYFVFVFVLIRSFNFKESFNFSREQADFSSESLRLWRSKTIELLGPPISTRFDGRLVFQSSLTYYFELLFLLPADFDPIVSSYLFMLFCAAMAIPLYFGVRMLGGQKSATMVLAIYTLFPLFIDYTKFLWNPNFQLSLTPILVLLAGLFKQRGKPFYFLLMSFFSGFLLLFHYQFLFVVIGLLIFSIFQFRQSVRHIFLTIFALGLGFSPMVVFEVRNHFYNMLTMLLFLEHRGQAFAPFQPYYFLGTGLVCLMLVSVFLARYVSNKVVGVVASGLLIISLFLYFPEPSHAFGMADHWNYLDELTVYHDIQTVNIGGYKVVNQIYDTSAAVQMYLQKLNRPDLRATYKDSRYLFVVSGKENFLDDPAPEINDFRKARVVRFWRINNYYFMVLLHNEEGMKETQ